MKTVIVDENDHEITATSLTPGLEDINNTNRSHCEDLFYSENGKNDQHIQDLDHVVSLPFGFPSLGHEENTSSSSFSAASSQLDCIIDMMEKTFFPDSEFSEHEEKVTDVLPVVDESLFSLPSLPSLTSRTSRTLGTPASSYRGELSKAHTMQFELPVLLTTQTPFRRLSHTSEQREASNEAFERERESYDSHTHSGSKPNSYLRSPFEFDETLPASGHHFFLPLPLRFESGLRNGAFQTIFAPSSSFRKEFVETLSEADGRRNSSQLVVVSMAEILRFLSKATFPLPHRFSHVYSEIELYLGAKIDFLLPSLPFLGCDNSNIDLHNEWETWSRSFHYFLHCDHNSISTPLITILPSSMHLNPLSKDVSLPDSIKESLFGVADTDENSCNDSRAHDNPRDTYFRSQLEAPNIYGLNDICHFSTSSLKQSAQFINALQSFLWSNPGTATSDLSKKNVDLSHYIAMFSSHSNPLSSSIGLPDKINGVVLFRHGAYRITTFSSPSSAIKAGNNLNLHHQKLHRASLCPASLAIQSFPLFSAKIFPQTTNSSILVSMVTGAIPLSLCLVGFDWLVTLTKQSTKTISDSECKPSFNSFASLGLEATFDVLPRNHQSSTHAEQIIVRHKTDDLQSDRDEIEGKNDQTQENNDVIRDRNSISLLNSCVGLWSLYSFLDMQFSSRPVAERAHKVFSCFQHLPSMNTPSITGTLNDSLIPRTIIDSLVKEIHPRPKTVYSSTTEEDLFSPLSLPSSLELTLEGMQTGWRQCVDDLRSLLPLPFLPSLTQFDCSNVAGFSIGIDDNVNITDTDDISPLLFDPSMAPTTYHRQSFTIRNVLVYTMFQIGYTMGKYAIASNTTLCNANRSIRDESPLVPYVMLHSGLEAACGVMYPSILSTNEPVRVQSIPDRANVENVAWNHQRQLSLALDHVISNLQEMVSYSGLLPTCSYLFSPPTEDISSFPPLFVKDEWDCLAFLPLPGYFLSSLQRSRVDLDRSEKTKTNSSFWTFFNLLFSCRALKQVIESYFEVNETADNNTLQHAYSQFRQKHSFFNLDLSPRQGDKQCPYFLFPFYSLCMMVPKVMYFFNPDVLAQTISSPDLTFDSLRDSKSSSYDLPDASQNLHLDWSTIFVPLKNGMSSCLPLHEKLSPYGHLRSAILDTTVLETQRALLNEIVRTVSLQNGQSMADTSSFVDYELEDETYFEKSTFTSRFVKSATNSTSFAGSGENGSKTAAHAVLPDVPSSLIYKCFLRQVMLLGFDDAIERGTATAASDEDEDIDLVKSSKPLGVASRLMITLSLILGSTREAMMDAFS